MCLNKGTAVHLVWMRVCVCVHDVDMHRVLGANFYSIIMLCCFLNL